MARMRPGDPVDGRAGPLGTIVGTREAADGQAVSEPGYVQVRRPRRFGLGHTTHLVPLAWVKDASPDAPRVVLDARRAEVAGCPPLREDDAIRDEVARVLAETRRPFRVAAVGVTVQRGVVSGAGRARGDAGAQRDDRPGGPHRSASLIWPAVSRTARRAAGRRMSSGR
jgi:hypothetical protein